MTFTYLVLPLRIPHLSSHNFLLPDFALQLSILSNHAEYSKKTSAILHPTPFYSKVTKLVSLVRNQTFDLPKVTILYMTLKTARCIIANMVILNCTNTELLIANM